MGFFICLLIIKYRNNINQSTFTPKTGNSTEHITSLKHVKNVDGQVRRRKHWKEYRSHTFVQHMKYKVTSQVFAQRHRVLRETTPLGFEVLFLHTFLGFLGTG